jgi:hypothetical protein
MCDECDESSSFYLAYFNKPGGKFWRPADRRDRAAHGRPARHRAASGGGARCALLRLRSGAGPAAHNGMPARHEFRHAEGSVMCLACELDALWYAEWEPLAAAGSAGVLPVLPEDPASVESGEAKSAGETPAPPGSTAAPRSGFLCEETE